MDKGKPDTPTVEALDHDIILSRLVLVLFEADFSSALVEGLINGDIIISSDSSTAGSVEEVKEVPSCSKPISSPPVWPGVGVVHTEVAGYEGEPVVGHGGSEEGVAHIVFPDPLCCLVILLVQPPQEAKSQVCSYLHVINFLHPGILVGFPDGVLSVFW